MDMSQPVTSSWTVKRLDPYIAWPIIWTANSDYPADDRLDDIYHYITEYNHDDANSTLRVDKNSQSINVLDAFSFPRALFSHPAAFQKKGKSILSSNAISVTAPLE